MSADVAGEILERIDADSVKILRLQFTDIQGQPKNVAIPVKQAEKALNEGIWLTDPQLRGLHESKNRTCY